MVLWWCTCGESRMVCGSRSVLVCVVMTMVVVMACDSLYASFCGVDVVVLT